MAGGRRWRALTTASLRRIRAELRLRHHAAALRRSALFDAAWYLATYPDVAVAGLDPVRHYLRAGVAEGRDPGPQFSTRDYLERNPDVARAGINPLLHYLRRADGEPALLERTNVEELARRRIADLRPLHAFPAPAAPGTRRVTLLTDSISPGSLFGGVATAILFATLLAERLGASLRLITECLPPDKGAVGMLLQQHGVAPPAEIAFGFADRSRAERREIDLHDGDLFVTTAWWTTSNLLHAVSPRQIIHMLQEDERMFYPHGDVNLLCSEILARPDLRFAVNTRLLHEHLIASGLEGLARTGAWFEPAFPQNCFYWEERAPTGPREFLFYARPFHPRNLYGRGLEAVSAAIERRILDPAHWNVTFVGRDLNAITLPHGVKPRLVQNLPWAEYAAVVRRTDLGLALMHTPHPSYPPLDLAACGAAAVTNRYGRKRTLASYSANILCVDADIEALVAGIAAGVQLAADLPARRRNYGQSALGRDWAAAFAPVFDRLLGS
jgi:hypothetical protein